MRVSWLNWATWLPLGGTKPEGDFSKRLSGFTGVYPHSATAASLEVTTAEAEIQIIKIVYFNSKTQLMLQ